MKHPVLVNHRKVNDMSLFDEIMGDNVFSIQPAVWWVKHPDAATKETRLAAWNAGRDFQIPGGPYLSINTTLTDRSSRFLDAKFGFEYPQAAEGADPVYYNPPKRERSF